MIHHDPSFAIIIYTFFEIFGIESFRKKSPPNLTMSVWSNPDFHRSSYGNPLVLRWATNKALNIFPCLLPGRFLQILIADDIVALEDAPGVKLIF
jgi:hypothetical protein